MAFDAKLHEIDPETGFMLDKDTGRPTGLASKPILRVSHDDEFPKWVYPHINHIQRDVHGNLAVPAFPEFHVRRHDGEVTVLVYDREQEAMALADPRAAPDEEIM